MPTTEEFYQQMNTAGSASNSRMSKPPDSRRPFWPNVHSGHNKKFVLCITDAFTKYAVVTAIAKKDAEMLADAIYAKFGILALVHTDGSKNLTSASLVQRPSGSVQ